MTELTGPGRAFLAFGAVAVIVGLAIGVPYLAYAGAAALAALTLDYAALSIMVHLSRARLRPQVERLVVPRGSEAYVILALEGGLRARLEAPKAAALAKVSPRAYELRLRASRAGQLRLRHLEAAFASPLRLLSTRSQVPIRPPLEVVVEPLAPRAIAAALALITAGLRPTASGQPLPPLVGPGSDYAYTDEAREGDELRRLDWKATARRNRPMVRRFWAEALSASAVVIDLTATDEVSADQLAYEAASLLAALASQEVGVYVYDGALRGPVPPAAALAIVAKELASAYPEAARVLDDYPGLRAEASLAQAVEGGKVVAITQLLSPLLSLLPPRCIIVQPTEPWLWARGLEEAYVLRARHDRLAAMARAAGCAIARSAADAIRALGTAQ